MIVNFFTTLLPVYCLGCEAEGALVCEKCERTSMTARTPSCFYCNRLSPSGRTCPSCYGRTGLAGVTIAFRYEDMTEVLVRRLKYEGVREVATFLAPKLVANLDLARFDAVVYVAADGVKRRQRGYDQARLLARALARRNNLLLLDALGRHTHISQIGLNRSARFRAVKDNFFAKNQAVIKDKRLLLVDDVLTTGATMSECARVLRSAGARSVWGLAVAKK